MVARPPATSTDPDATLAPSRDEVRERRWEPPPDSWISWGALFLRLSLRGGELIWHSRLPLLALPPAQRPEPGADEDE